MKILFDGEHVEDGTRENYAVRTIIAKWATLTLQFKIRSYRGTVNVPGKNLLRVERWVGSEWKTVFYELPMAKWEGTTELHRMLDGVMEFVTCVVDE